MDHWSRELRILTRDEPGNSHAVRTQRKGHSDLLGLVLLRSAYNRCVRSFGRFVASFAERNNMRLHRFIMFWLAVGCVPLLGLPQNT
jgi:hypothetical protein